MTVDRLPRRTHLHLVNASYPKQGTGTEIVLHRHLLRLAQDGWRVTVSAPFSNSPDKDSESTWTDLPLPARKWWWPSYREESPSLERIRSELLAAHLAGHQRNNTPTHVLSNAYKFYPSIALRYARHARAKFILILHDQDELWPNSKNLRQLVRRRVEELTRKADRVLAVSQQLLDCYEVSGAKAAIIPPIPGERLYDFGWTNVRRKQLRLYHAGSLHPFQAQPLGALADRLSPLGGRLVLVAPEWNQAARQLVSEHTNIDRLNLFINNEEAVAHVAKNALAFVVTYAFDVDAQPWCRTSFPSKLLEFMRAGVPVIVLAPEVAAVADWAARENWQPLVTALAPENIDKAIGRLLEQSSWEALREQGSMLARGKYSAQSIHDSFVKCLS